MHGYIQKFSKAGSSIYFRIIQHIQLCGHLLVTSSLDNQDSTVMTTTHGSAVLNVYTVFCTELHKLRYSKNCLFLSLILYVTRLAVTVHLL